MDALQVGDIVVSKINTTYNGKYKVLRINKDTCWVTPTVDCWLFDWTAPVYKNIRLSILKRVAENG
jgi:hypothetical protein